MPLSTFRAATTVSIPLGGCYLGIHTWIRLRVVHERSRHILICVIKYGAVALLAIRLRFLFRTLHREERFRATQMRSSQSHPRTFELGLKRLKFRRVRKCLLMDRGLQPATRINNLSLTKHTAFLLSGAGANANAVIAQLGRWYAIPMSPEMPSRSPPSPRPGGLAQPWRSSPGRQGPLCRTNPATDRTLAGRSALLRNSRGSIHQMTYLLADQQVYERVQHAQIGSEWPRSRDYDEIRLRRREDTCRTLTIVMVPGRAR